MRVAFMNRMQLSEVSILGKSLIVWQTDNNFYCQTWDSINGFVEIIIPKYFLTDLNSVPRAPFSYLLFADIGRRAGLLHDALYSDWSDITVCEFFTREPINVTREWADNVLYVALIECGVPKWKAWSMWMAVKAMGGKYYKRKPEYEHGVPYYEEY